MDDPDKRHEDLERRLAEMRAKVEQLEAAFAAQRRGKEELQHVLNMAPVLVCVAGLDGYYKQVNATFERVLGYREEESLSRPFIEFIHPDDHAMARMHLESLAAGEVLVNFEDRNICKDGSYRWLSWTVVPIPEKGIVYGIGYDVTDRKKAEESLLEAHRQLEERVRERTAELGEANERLGIEIVEHRQAAEQLQTIYDGMVDGLLIADIATRRFVNANVSMLQMLGYTREELLLKSVDDIHPAEALSGVMERFRAQAEGCWTVAEGLPVIRKDGNIFFADVTTSNIQYKDQHCAIGIFRDVTERKRIHEALQREHQVLRHLLASQDRERQLIAYEIHDGLAQHLAAAIMHFETLHQTDDRIPLRISQNCSAGLDMLRRSLAEARRLISGLRPPILDESGIVAAIGHLVHDIAAQGGPEVEVHSRVRFDRLDPVLENAIYRIVQECLTNAHRHSQSDRVRIDLVEEEERIRIKVTDWGVGFDPSGVDESRFGLDGIRERARVLDGQAVITSVLGKGTKVSVELPVSLDRPPAN